MASTYAFVTGSTGILRSDGAVIPQDPNNLDYEAFLAWVAAGNTPTPPPPPPPSTTLSSLEFIARFTSSEQTVITTAGQTNSTILLWLIQCAGAGEIDVTDARTIAGVNALVSAGLLSSTRIASILADPT